MHIHILGIAGTFMGGIALIAGKLGHKVSGQDNNIYPPMSEQLLEQEINFTTGYHIKNLPVADLYIIGNALSRNNECVEYILSNNLNYTSGAKWLGENILKDKWVIAISGTHGKTTTSSIVTHILEDNGFNPSFLIGGICENFKTSARLTDSIFFVIEADEYDTAFFDKRSKFIHYYPNTLVINNVEFDHADIFNSIEDIYTQFHNLIRTLSKETLVIYPNDENIQQIIDKGFWSSKKIFKAQNYQIIDNKSVFKIAGNNVKWNLIGKHNINNAIAAVYAALHAGIPIQNSCKSLASFNGVKRRMELKFQNNFLTIYDDFAHHPTSIKTTITGLRKKVKDEKIIVVLELRSNTMKSGFFNQELIASLTGADEVLLYKNLINATNITTYNNTSDMIDILKNKTGNIIFMSNGGFDNIVNKLINKL